MNLMLVAFRRNIWYLGMFGGMAFAALVLTYKPDTRYASRRISSDPFNLPPC